MYGKVDQPQEQGLCGVVALTEISQGICPSRESKMIRASTQGRPLARARARAARACVRMCAHMICVPMVGVIGALGVLSVFLSSD